jgi:predicted Fe-S protein YdhL (DUF1289 family)
LYEHDLFQNQFPLFGIMLYFGRLTLIPVMTETATPCEKVCIVDHASGLCRGCGRSLAEIERWTAFREDERLRIMRELPRRLDVLRAHSAARAKR